MGLFIEKNSWGWNAETLNCDRSHEGKSGLPDSEIGRGLDILDFDASSW
jgi:hypothetical protein